jgi:hypothetical protein
MQTTIPHTHPDPLVITDDQLLAHIDAEHAVPADEPWLLNEANREMLLLRHVRAHATDPVSFEGMRPPPWAQGTEPGYSRRSTTTT